MQDQATGRQLVGEFEERVRKAGRGVFLLDYDGTLAPFAADPQHARPYDGVAEAVDNLVDTGNARVIIVTGRYLRTSLPAMGTRASLETWGSHGRERLRPDGAYEVVPVNAETARALAEADGWRDEMAAAGAWCEAKPGSLAIHWRIAAARRIPHIRNLVIQKFDRGGFKGILELRAFDGGMELHAQGPNKGDVVRAVIAECAEGTPIAYCGDDFTDEDAFRALPDGGLRVLVRPEWRATDAHVWVQPPEGLLTLMRGWRNCLGKAAQ